MTIPIIMDCDPGIDDAAALTMAINSPKLDLQLVTTVAGNVKVDKTTKNAQKIINFFDQGHKIPVASGAKKPLLMHYEDASEIHGKSGMPGYDFEDDLVAPIQEDAVQALYHQIMKNDEPITLVVTGAYTNVGLLLSEYPEVRSNIERIVAMGGSMSGGNVTSSAEFNIYTDPHAAAIMYNSGIPINMIGLDVTEKADLYTSNIEKLVDMNQSGKMLHAIITSNRDHNKNGITLHDVNTIFYLLHPESFDMHPMWVDIQTDGPAVGTTVGDTRAVYHDGKTNANVALGIDADKFNDWFMDQVSKMK